MRVAVLGAGAIGGFIAAMLARKFSDVAVVARGAHLEAIRSHGLRVQHSDAGSFTASVRAVADLRELLPLDVVLLAVKAQQLPAALEQVKPAIAAGVHFVTMQNGIPFWYFPERALRSVDPNGELRASFPQAQIIGSVVHVSGHVVEPGTIAQSGGMRYIVGTPENGDPTVVDSIVRLFEECGLAPERSVHIRKDIWNKMLGNVSLNPVSALTRFTIRPMLQDDTLRALIAAMMREAITVARSTGVHIEVMPEERIAYAARLSDVKTSMLQDVEAGRALELEPIVGAVLELARDAHLCVPHLETVYALTKGLESSYLLE
ncbi:MAG: oxidoreductase [Candidatus Meridianibacter frigidus]|nr:MAG: oxidoreductase [Candidatus Eremiobacteraeota bacterium]